MNYRRQLSLYVKTTLSLTTLLSTSVVMYFNSLPPNDQEKGPRFSINILLNPTENAAPQTDPSATSLPYRKRVAEGWLNSTVGAPSGRTALLPIRTSTSTTLPHPPQRTSEVVLPPLGSLNLLTSPGPKPQSTSSYYQDYQDNHQFHQHGNKYRHRRSPGSCGSMSGRSRSTSPTTPSHSNIPYTLEQVHFIQYYREDKKVQWQAIVQPFKRQFPRVVVHQSSSNSPKRGKGALECRYYRAQVYPKIDDEGNFVRDHNNEYEMVNIRVRDRQIHPHKAILEDYIKLVTRCPEEVLKYSWTDDKDKAEARNIIANRARQGRGELPGAIIRVRTTTF
ncbi:hypothetical protein V501_06937 [Pseudogymnoascus sp. VKM F-4519 (FW-2642)]|nr:hypothetical protein V501_06937 [Pseudogymnoascus sp. VKM F-4519 (FW-2642)]